MVKLTNETSKMCNQATCADLNSAISSPELADGVLPCALQDGQTTEKCGQALVRASRFPVLDDKKAKQMIATYGQYGNVSLASASLQRSLESKLQARLPTGGLTMFIKGWNRKATPSGRLYCQLAVSVRPISATDYGLWVSPTTQDHSRGNKPPRSWDTGIPLSQQVALWATANTMDHMPPRSKEAMERQFSTTRKGKTTPANLREQAIPAMWPTASARDHKDTGDMSNSMVRKDGKERNDTIGRMAFGLTTQMENKGSLNPQFVCWLMGYPTEWESCAGMVTRLFRKLRRSL